MKVKIKEYKNGTTLIFEKDDKVKYTSFSLCVTVGSQDEKQNESGVAHFLEHLFFKSTKKLSAEEIGKRLDSLGASINAFTKVDQTQYHFRCLNEHFEECLKIFSQMFYQGKFDKEEVDKERKVILEEIKSKKDISSYCAYMNGLTSIYAGTPFERPILGDKEVIKNISIEKIKEFKKRTYTSDKIFLSVVSSIKFNELEQLIQKYFKTESKIKKYSQKLVPQKITLSPLNNRILQTKTDRQVNLYVFIKTTGYLEPNKPAQILLSEIIGGGIGSRFFIELREKLRLAYHVSCWVDSLQDCGTYVFYIGTSPNNVKLALSKMKEFLQDLHKNGITLEELERVKTRVKSQLIFSAENKLKKVISNASVFVKDRRVKSINEVIENYNNVTLSKIQEMLEELFNEKVVVVSAIGQDITLDDLSF